MIPEKKPCPCGYISPSGKGCPQFVLPGFSNPMDEEQADEIIEVYKDAERFRFLMANPGVASVLQFQRAALRRAYIDEKMANPGKGGRKK